jgi:hypothetical protein
MRRLLFFPITILFFVNASNSIAQKLTGTVIDAQTKQPLSYVHIGVIGKNVGEISHEQGKFEIDLSKVSTEDELVFSMLGYELFKGNCRCYFIELPLLRL